MIELCFKWGGGQCHPALPVADPMVLYEVCALSTHNSCKWVSVGVVISFHRVEWVCPIRVYSLIRGRFNRSQFLKISYKMRIVWNGAIYFTGLWLEKCFIASPQLLLASHMRHCARNTVRMKALSSEAEHCSVQCNDCALCVPCSASLASWPQWLRSLPQPVGDWRSAVVFAHSRHVHSARAELRTHCRPKLQREWKPSAARVARGEARRAMPHSHTDHRRGSVRCAAAAQRHTHRTRAL